MSGKARLAKLSIALVAVLGLGGLAAAGPASATTGLYADWTISPSDPDVQNHSGTLAFPNALLPGATYTANKSVDDGQSTRIATGTATYGDWLTTQTPFGAVFGPSGPSTTIQFFRQRINLGTVSTTTYTFDEPFPANRLGFAFGDIDVDNITLTATDGNGAPVSGADLAGGTFNYCAVTVDVPTDCDGGPYPVPVWTPGSNGGTITPTPPAPGIQETSGASAWFRPTVGIKTLTVTFEAYVGAGTPSYRAWFAAIPRTAIGTEVDPEKNRVPSGGNLDVVVSTGNEGDFEATDVETCLRIPKRFVVVKKGGTKLTGKKACWTVDSLPPGGETDKEITLRPTGGTSGKADLQSTATSPDADRATDRARVTVKKSKKPRPKPKPPTG